MRLEGRERKGVCGRGGRKRAKKCDKGDREGKERQMGIGKRVYDWVSERESEGGSDGRGGKMDEIREGGLGR